MFCGTLCFVHILFVSFVSFSYSGSLLRCIMYKINVKGHKLRDVERTSV